MSTAVVAIPDRSSHDSGNAVLLSREAVDARALVPLAERRRRLPAVPPHDRVAAMEAVVATVNNGAGLWARPGGSIGNSEVRDLVVHRPPTADEIVHGVDPETPIVKKGYEALSVLFEHSPLDVQTEIYRQLSRRRPWWAWLDVFGWFRGARAPVERFEEEYDPGGNLEVFVMGHDQGAWFLPRVFTRWFRFTVGRGDWSLGKDEVTGRGGDVEADSIEDRGYAPSLLRQFQDMAPAERWRALQAIAPDLMDTSIGTRLAEIDPTWFDLHRFGVSFVYDPDDPENGERLRQRADEARTFLTKKLAINPYTIERGLDLGFLPVSERFPEIPSEPEHQFVVDVRNHLPTRPGQRFDLIEFAQFVEERYPRWPQLTPEMLRRVAQENDAERFLHKQVDLWGEAVLVQRHRYTFPKHLSWATRERVGTDRNGNPTYRTRRSAWVANVPAIRVALGVRGQDRAAMTRALYERVGDAVATGHYSHVTHRPADLRIMGGQERFHGRLDTDLNLIL